MEIITGYTGENHVTSADDASLYRGMLGQDDYVLEVGNKFAATIIDNNTVRVMDGDLVIQGHQARIRANDYNEVTIDNGTPGEKRNDLIVARYLKNTETGIESINLEVIKGTPGATATDPEIVQEDLKIGGTQRDFSLYRVSIDGISLESVTSLFSTIPNLKVLKSHLAESVAQVGGAHGLVMESGIWTPAIITDATQPTVSYAVRRATYLRIGKLIKCSFFIRCTLSGGMGGLFIAGLPFAINNLDVSGTLSTASLGAAPLNFYALRSVDSGLPRISVRKDSRTQAQVTDVNGGTTFDISGSIIYETY